MTTNPLPWCQQPRSLERRTLAVICSILLHAVLLCFGAVAAAVVTANGEMLAIPRDPLLVLAVALIMAHCSLGAIWWARSDWSTHIRTIVAMICCGSLWLLLVTLLQTTRHSGIAAAAWAACLATQVVVVAAVTSALELLVHFQQAARRTRFSIFNLLAVTGIVALILGIAGAMAARAGFRLADIPAWQYFQQLQAVGLAGAALAIGVYSAVRFFSKSAYCVAIGTLAVALLTALAVWAMIAIFGAHAGASAATIAWLLGGEGLFLIAAIVPPEMAARGALHLKVERSAAGSP